MIETTITARMLVHDERPAMDHEERLGAELALTQALRETLMESFLQFKPADSRAGVQHVSVAFSGHVTP